eukprot:6028026-Lingulodinium_polyedra.AAC.1
MRNARQLLAAPRGHGSEYVQGSDCWPRSSPSVATTPVNKIHGGSNWSSVQGGGGGGTSPAD